MTKNPILNAIAASIYIILVACLMFFGSKFFNHSNSLLIPIAIISLFTLSASIMGYLFLYQPFLLFVDGHKKSAVDFFLKTVGVFAIITILIFILLFLGVFK